MTIKAKLIANTVLIAVIIGAISLTSYLSMSFLQGKLAQLTEKSAPFQIHTLELQRELQKCISSLIRANSAQTMAEFSVIRSDSERSLSAIAEIQKNLVVLQHISTQGDVLELLTPLTQELFAATEDRITSSTAASEANNNVQLKMAESATRLGELQLAIKQLQSSYAKNFANALDNTSRLSARLAHIEELRNLVRDLQLIDVTVQNALKGSTLRIAKGKLNAVHSRITKNEYFKQSSTQSKLTTGFNERLFDYIRLLASNISQKELELKSNTTANVKDISGKLNDLFQTLDQDSILAREELNIATNRQATIFAQANRANRIQETNAELGALALRITNETNRLFTLKNEEEILALDGSIRTLFSKITEHISVMSHDLTDLDNNKERGTLQTAGSALSAINQEIYKPHGIIATLTQKAVAIRRVGFCSDKLRELVAKQAVSGKENVTRAQADQEKALQSVNSSIRKSVSQIIIIGCSAIIIGLIFGYWMYRSVLLPLRTVLLAVRQQQRLGNEKALLAEAVASGNLDREVSISTVLHLEDTHINHDEVGMVLHAVVAMSGAQVTLDMAFAKMTAALRFSRSEDMHRDSIKSGLFELNKLIRTEQRTEVLAERALAFIAAFLTAQIGLLYRFDPQSDSLKLLAGYAVSLSGLSRTSIPCGEGLVGQAASERRMICLTDIPADYLTITSAVGSAAPSHVTILPVMHNDELFGIMELGSFSPFTDKNFEFINLALEELAIALKINHSRQMVDELLIHTRQQTELLLAKQEHLFYENPESKI